MQYHIPQIDNVFMVNHVKSTINLGFNGRTQCKMKVLMGKSTSINREIEDQPTIFFFSGG
jgi:hypothetical protein